MKTLFILLLIGIQLPVLGQNLHQLSLEEFLGIVKTHHPLLKQANLALSDAQAKLLKARGAFDPKIELDNNKKEFKGTTYFNQLNAAFKIPSWYGIEFKAAVEDNYGNYLNPQYYTADQKLYQVGAEVSLAKGLLINERMATLKQAKLYKQQAKAENQLAVNELLYEATNAYFNWLKSYKEQLIFGEFTLNAMNRLNSIEKSVTLGERPPIDITEAKIAYNSRKLSQEKARLNYIKAGLALSNYLWIDEVPVELKKEMIPDINTLNKVESVLAIDGFSLESLALESHPKLRSLTYKKETLQVEKRLQLNNLLPTINVQYNFLNQSSDIINNLNPTNYKAGLTFQMPLFLRKERANLQLATIKLQSVEWDQLQTKLSLKNKISAIVTEIESYSNQLLINKEIVSDYQKLLSGEERKFELGESALFYIITRESKLIESKLKEIDAEYTLLVSKSKLFNVISTTSPEWNENS